MSRILFAISFLLFALMARTSSCQFQATIKSSQFSNSHSSRRVVKPLARGNVRLHHAVIGKSNLQFMKVQKPNAPEFLKVNQTDKPRTRAPNTSRSRAVLIDIQESNAAQNSTGNQDNGDEKDSNEKSNSLQNEDEDLKLESTDDKTEKEKDQKANEEQAAKARRFQQELFSPIDATPLARLTIPKAPDGSDFLPKNRAQAKFGNYESTSPTLEYLQSDSNRAHWRNQTFCWQAPNTVHEPLLFEEITVERYGLYSPYVQPLYSAAHFFATIPIMPYKAGVHQFREPIYTLRHFRPGDCAPRYYYPMPFSLRGLTWQALAIIAVTYSI